MNAHGSIEVIRLEEIDSTQAEAKRRIAALSAPRTPSILLVAQRQTAGVGRFGRAWESPRGGLWATLATPLNAAGEGQAPETDGLGLRIGVACTRLVRGLLGDAHAARVRHKWPNDVVIDGHKVLGALCEVVHAGPHDWLVIGVGLNANLGADQLPAPLRNCATTLRDAAGVEIDLGGAALDLATRLLHAVHIRGLPAATLDEARSMLWGVGRETEVSLPTGGKVRATLISLDARGDAVFEQDGSRWVAPSSVRFEA